MNLNLYYKNTKHINFSQQKIKKQFKNGNRQFLSFSNLNENLHKKINDNQFFQFKNDQLQNVNIIKLFDQDLNNQTDLNNYFSEPKKIENIMLNRYLNMCNIFIENKFIPISIFRKGYKNKLFYKENEIIIFLNQKNITKITLHNMLNQIIKIYQQEIKNER